MKANRFREAMANSRMPIGHMIMEFGTRGIARSSRLGRSGFCGLRYGAQRHLILNASVDLVAWS